MPLDSGEVRRRVYDDEAELSAERAGLPGREWRAVVAEPLDAVRHLGDAGAEAVLHALRHEVAHRLACWVARRRFPRHRFAVAAVSENVTKTLSPLKQRSSSSSAGPA